jgi:trimeric autotransporter adhesin
LIQTAGTTLQVNAANFVLRGVALHGGGSGPNRTGELTLGAAAKPAANALIEQNLFGTTASAFALPGSATSQYYGINVVNGSGTIRNNLIGYSATSGLNYVGGDAPLVIQNNEFQQNGYTTPGGDGVTVFGGSSARALTITGNLISSNNSSGIQFEIGNVASTSVSNNTISSNGKGGAATRLEGSGIHYLARTASVTSSNTDLIRKNVIANNLESGIVLNYGQNNVTLSQNSMYANGKLSIDFTAPDGYVGGNINYGQGNGVTPNDGLTGTRQPNNGLDYPVFTSVVVSGTTLSVSGYVGSAAGQPTFGNALIEIFRADNTPANQDGPVIVGDGKSVPHGEGRSYLGSLTADASGNFSGSLTVPGVAASDSFTATATLASSTSELSPNAAQQPPAIRLTKLGRNVTKNTAFVDSAGSVAASPKDVLEYCLIYSNAGGPAPSFRITDSVPGLLNALTSGYGTSDSGLDSGLLWANGTTIAAGAAAAPAAPTSGKLTSSSADTDKGSLSDTGGTFSKGVMTFDLGLVGLAAGGKGTVCFRTQVP